MALMGLQLGYLLGGSILVETVFNWPGSGGLMNLAIFRRDMPVLSATILTIATLFVAHQHRGRRAAGGRRPADPTVGARLEWPMRHDDDRAGRPRAAARRAAEAGQAYWSERAAARVPGQGHHRRSS